MKPKKSPRKRAPKFPKHLQFDHAEKELGGFDIMVNNAGIAQVQPLAEVTPQEVETILRESIIHVGLTKRLRECYS